MFKYYEDDSVELEDIQIGEIFLAKGCFALVCRVSEKRYMIIAEDDIFDPLGPLDPLDSWDIDDEEYDRWGKYERFYCLPIDDEEYDRSGEYYSNNDLRNKYERFYCLPKETQELFLVN